MLLPDVKPGDPLDAKRYNDLQRIAESALGISTGGSADRHTIGEGSVVWPVSPDLFVIKFAENFGHFSGEHSDESAGNYRDGVAKKMMLDPSTGEFIESGYGNHTDLTSPLSLPHDAGEIALALRHGQAAKLIPLTPRTIRHARTCSDNEQGTYPSRGESIVFPIKFITVAYEASDSTLTYSSTDMFPNDGDNDDHPHDDYVLNLAGDGDVSASYIAEGVDIWVYEVAGKWFTYLDTIEDESSSSSDLSSANSSSSQSNSESSDSSSNCVQAFDYPVYTDASELTHVLGKKANGCMGWFPVGDCDDGDESSSST